MPVCQLCLQEREQLRDSHILSEFLYKRLYNSQHKFLPIKVPAGEMLKEEQKGYRRKLLCHACEQKFMKYENYATYFFNQIVGGRISRLRSRSLTRSVRMISGFDYQKLKYFLLSIIWRLSISPTELFPGYKLERQEELRKRLVDESPMPPGFFPIVVSQAIFNNEKINSLFLFYKDHIEIEKLRRLRVVVDGIVLDYFETIECKSNLILFQCLQENGSFLLAEHDISEVVGSEQFQRILNDETIRRYHGM